MRNSSSLSISSSRVTEWLRLEVTSWRASPPKPLLWQGSLDLGAQDSVQAPPPGVLQVPSCPAAFWMGVPQHGWVGFFFCTSCWITHLQKPVKFFNFFKNRMVFNVIIWKNNFFFLQNPSAEAALYRFVNTRLLVLA